MGRFFALNSTFGAPCNHSDEAPNMGCDKCYWKQKGKRRPTVIVTLVAPEAPEKPSYPVVNNYDMAAMPNSPWYEDLSGR